ncbi:hypothetical protein X975_19892, partial [Stegodyphus mimosarum]
MFCMKEVFMSSNLVFACLMTSISASKFQAWEVMTVNI